MPFMQQATIAADQLRAEEADARRIAASPKLLEKAKELLEIIESYELEGELDAGCDGRGPVEELRAAIAESEGK